jgi:hypothetical protein
VGKAVVETGFGIPLSWFPFDSVLSGSVMLLCPLDSSRVVSYVSIECPSGREMMNFGLIATRESGIVLGARWFLHGLSVSAIGTAGDLRQTRNFGRCPDSTSGVVARDAARRNRTVGYIFGTERQSTFKTT